MAGAGQKLTLADLSRSLAAAAANAPALAHKFLQAAAVLCGAELKRGMAEGVSPDGTPYKPLKFPRPNGGDRPLRDTGALLASLGGGSGHVRRVGGNSLVIGTNLDYAATHQYGATILPAKGKYLSIPLTAAAKKAGGAAQYPGQLVGRYGKVGGVLLDAQSGEKQYALAKKAVIPARPFVGFSESLKEKLAKLAAAIFGAALGVKRGAEQP